MREQVDHPAAIDRALKDDRKQLALKETSAAEPGKLLKKHIPVRTHYPWDERKLQTSLLGFFEIDTVHHCGDQDSGELCFTLNAADVASVWRITADFFPSGRSGHTNAVLSKIFQ
jgi:hypothetical protein